MCPTAQRWGNGEERRGRKEKNRVSAPRDARKKRADCRPFSGILSQDRDIFFREAGRRPVGRLLNVVPLDCQRAPSDLFPAGSPFEDAPGADPIHDLAGGHAVEKRPRAVVPAAGTLLVRKPHLSGFVDYRRRSCIVVGRILGHEAFGNYRVVTDAMIGHDSCGLLPLRDSEAGAFAVAGFLLQPEELWQHRRRNVEPAELLLAESRNAGEIRVALYDSRGRLRLGSVPRPDRFEPDGDSRRRRGIVVVVVVAEAPGACGPGRLAEIPW